MHEALAGWTRLPAALAARPSQDVANPSRGRVGAALILVRELAGRRSAAGPEDLEILYTRRPEHLTHHPGQISFPGGRVEQGESVEQAAVREAAEEVALDPSSVQLLGHLPAFYIPPSGFWLHPVVARWREPHPLAAAESEVGEILPVRLSVLLDEQAWRGVHLQVGWTWAWQLDERHVLWGATAVVTSMLLDRLAPGWDGGASPSQLPQPEPAPVVIVSAPRRDGAEGFE